MSEQTLCQTQNDNCCAGSGAECTVYRPRVDLIDTGESVILWADLPGVDESSVEITIEKDTLTLKATAVAEQLEGKKPLLREFGERCYERTFSISEEIDREGVEAVMTQGVLKLTLPKSKQAAVQKVTVKAG